MDGRHDGPHGGGGGRHFDPRNPHDPMQTKILNCQNLEELTNVILLDQFEFNLVHCSTAFNKFGVFRKDRQKLNSREQGALKALIEMAKNQQFLPRQASNIIRAIAVGSLADENPQALALMESLIEQDTYQQWKPMELAHIVEALATMQLKHEGFLAKMAKEIPERNLSQFNAQDIVVFLSSYADLHVPAPEVFDAIAKELLRREFKQDLKDKSRRGDSDSTIFTLQRLLAILCAYARAGHKVETAVLEKIGHEFATRQLKYMKPSEVANVAWAFTVLEYQPKAVFDKVVAEVDVRRIKFSYHHLSTIIWAFASISAQVDQRRNVFEMIGKELKFRSERGVSVEALVNTAWGFTKAGISTKDLFVKLANDVSYHRDLNDFTPRQIAHLTWAFAHSQFRHSSLYETISKHIAASSLQEYSSYDLATIACGLGASRAKNIQAGLVAIAQEVFSRRGLSSFSDSEFASLLRGVAETEDEAYRLNAEVYQSVAQEIQSRGWKAFKSEDVANIVYSFARLGWRDSNLFEQVAELLVVQSMEDFAVTDLANVAWAFTNLGFRHRALFDRICLACSTKGWSSSVSDVILLLWSLCCNQHVFSVAAQKVFLEMTIPQFKDVPNPERTLENASMVAQILVFWNQVRGDEGSIPPVLDQLRKPDGWFVQTISSSRKSEMNETQKQVSKTLQEMGYVHLVDGFVTSEGLDSSIRLSTNVLVDVLDSNRDVLTDGKSVSGSVAFKVRLLENCGFYVAHVNSKEWQDVGDGREGFMEERMNALSRQQS